MHYKFLQRDNSFVCFCSFTSFSSVTLGVISFHFFLMITVKIRNRLKTSKTLIHHKFSVDMLNPGWRFNKPFWLRSICSRTKLTMYKAIIRSVVLYEMWLPIFKWKVLQTIVYLANGWRYCWKQEWKGSSNLIARSGRSRTMYDKMLKGLVTSCSELNGNKDSELTITITITTKSFSDTLTSSICSDNSWSLTDCFTIRGELLLIWRFYITNTSKHVFRAYFISE